MSRKISSYSFSSRALGLLLGCSAVLPSNKSFASEIKPNFIIILTDDQGYNDLGCFGSKNIKTPRIDQMAKEGVRFTSFYAQAVCGPSRGALMTARYPVRIGDGWTTNPDEITVAEVLKKVGYSTACIGKWDMSRRLVKPGQMPNDQGFDYYFGTLGATDEGKVEFYRNREKAGGTSDMSALTSMYTKEALTFIEQKKDVPFFLYLAHSMPHVKIGASPKFKGKSAGELYGDVIEEIDWNVGLILDQLKKLGLDKDTYVLFTSDNGPWKGKEEEFRGSHDGQLATGCADPLRGGKASHFEGGFRVPAVLWGGVTPSGKVLDGIVSTLDVLPTFTRLAGRESPNDRPIDGFDQVNYITGKSKNSARTYFYYFIRNEVHAVRSGQWKLLIPNRQKSYDGFNNVLRDPKPTEPELYDLFNDISETTNVAEYHPDIVKNLMELSEKAPHNLIDIVSKEGNYLLNVRPNGKGVIIPAAVEILKETGSWQKIYGESIYGADGIRVNSPENIRFTTKPHQLFIHLLKADSSKVIIKEMNQITGKYLDRIHKINLLADVKKKPLKVQYKNETLTIDMPTLLISKTEYNKYAEVIVVTD